MHPWRSRRVVSHRGPSRSSLWNSRRAMTPVRDTPTTSGSLCDGRWLRRVVKVVPSPGSFEPGESEANASLSILDPDTGDPVYTARFERNVWLVGSVAPVLWDQTGARDGAIVSADASDDTLDAQGADDFVVPAGHVWSITSVFAPGSNGATHAPPFLVPGVNVFIYEDGGDRPGALITSYVGVPPTTAPDDLTIPLSPALTLQPGTYWISVQADVSSLGPGTDGSGRSARIQPAPPVSGGIRVAGSEAVPKTGPRSRARRATSSSICEGRPRARRRSCARPSVRYGRCVRARRPRSRAR